MSRRTMRNAHGGTHMSDHQTCPECGSIDSRHVHTEITTDTVERVHVCEDCPAEWTVEYGDPLVTEVVLVE